MVPRAAAVQQPESYFSPRRPGRDNLSSECWKECLPAFLPRCVHTEGCSKHCTKSCEHSPRYAKHQTALHKTSHLPFWLELRILGRCRRLALVFYICPGNRFAPHRPVRDMIHHKHTHCKDCRRPRGFLLGLDQAHTHTHTMRTHV